MNNQEKHERYYSLRTKQVDFFDNVSNEKNKNDFFCLHIFTDKTSDKRLATEQANREYQQLMLSSVAHEFRNPLNSISGNLELINLVTKEPKVAKFATSAHNSWVMLNIYVEDILDLGRIEKDAFHFNPVYFKVSQFPLIADSLTKYFMTLSKFSTMR